MKIQGCFALVLMACAASSAAAAGGLRGQHPGQARGLAADTSSIFGDGVEIHWDHSHVAYLRDGDAFFPHGTWSDTGTTAQLKAAWCAKTWETYYIAGSSWGSLNVCLKTVCSKTERLSQSYYHKFDCDRVQQQASWCQATRYRHGIEPYSTSGTAGDSDWAKWNKLDCNTKATWQDVPIPAQAAAAAAHPGKPVGYACTWDKDCAGDLICPVNRCSIPPHKFGGR